MKIKRSKLIELANKYIGNDSLDAQNQILLKIGVARAARLSYMNFDGEIDYEKDIKLHDQLLESRHLSCFEHCARVMREEEYHSFIKGYGTYANMSSSLYFEGDSIGWCNNYKGFIQYRYLIENNYK